MSGLGSRLVGKQAFGPLCVEFASSPHICVAFLQVLWPSHCLKNIHVRLTGDSKQAVRKECDCKCDCFSVSMSQYKQILNNQNLQRRNKRH